MTIEAEKVFLKLSIVVTIYNKEEYIAQCLDSISLIKRADIEVILVDDGSLDKSSSICQSYLGDCRFKYVRKENGGAASARNLGIELSEGKYLLFVDADDVISPQIADLVEVAESSNSEIVDGKKKFFKENVSFESLVLEGKNPYKELTAIEFLMNGFSACGRIFHKKLFPNNGLWFPEGIWSEDNGFIPYLANTAKKIIRVNCLVYGYRKPESNNASKSLRCIDDALVSLSYLRSICKNQEIYDFAYYVTLGANVVKIIDRGSSMESTIKHLKQYRLTNSFDGIEDEDILRALIIKGKVERKQRYFISVALDYIGKKYIRVYLREKIFKILKLR